MALESISIEEKDILRSHHGSIKVLYEQDSKTIRIVLNDPNSSMISTVSMQLATSVGSRRATWNALINGQAIPIENWNVLSESKFDWSTFRR